MARERCSARIDGGRCAGLDGHDGDHYANARERKAVRVHVVKEWPAPFAEFLAGLRDFEIRVNDRDYKAGDRLVVQEFDPHKGQLTGRELHRSIKLVVSANSYGGMFHGALAPNFVVLGLVTPAVKP